METTQIGIKKVSTWTTDSLTPTTSSSTGKDKINYKLSRFIIYINGEKDKNYSDKDTLSTCSFLSSNFKFPISQIKNLNISNKIYTVPAAHCSLIAYAYVSRIRIKPIILTVLHCIYMYILTFEFLI